MRHVFTAHICHLLSLCIKNSVYTLNKTKSFELCRKKCKVFRSRIGLLVLQGGPKLKPPYRIIIKSY